MAKIFVGPFPTCEGPISFSKTVHFHEGEKYNWGHGLLNSTEYDGGDVSIVGFVQSFKYFLHDDAIEQVRSAFTLQEHIQRQVDQFLDPFCSQGKQIVGFHICRQDYAREWGGAGRPTNLYDPSFLAKTMKYMRDKYGGNNLVFVVASDDIAWCKQMPFFQIKDVVFSEKDTKYLDMSILSACDHNVVTVGTYGWWEAWLGKESKQFTNRTVVYYGDEIRLEHPRVKLRVQEGTLPIKGDRYPKHWVSLV